MAVNIHIHAHRNDEDFETAITPQMRVFERDEQIVLSRSSRILAGDTQDRIKDIPSLISISKNLPEERDDILNEIIDYIEILNIQRENL